MSRFKPGLAYLDQHLVPVRWKDGLSFLSPMWEGVGLPYDVIERRAPTNTSDLASWTSEQTGQGRIFDGSSVDDYAAGTPTAFGTGDCSILAVFRMSGTINAQINTIFSAGNTGAAGTLKGWKLFVNSFGTSDRKIVFESDTSVASASNVVVDNDLHVVLVTRKSGTVTIYLDGVSVATGTAAGDWGGSGFLARIGALTNVAGGARTFEFDGNILLAATWKDRALSQDDAIGFTNDPFALLRGWEEEYQVPTPLASKTKLVLNIVNGDAETTDLTGWTTNGGAFAAVQGGQSGFPAASEGSYYFYGGAAATSRMYQEFTIGTEFIRAVDAELVTITGDWIQNSLAGSDLGEMEFVFLDGNDATISTDNSGLTGPTVWTARSHTATLPTLTRKVRVQLHANRNAGVDNDAYFDTISACLEVETAFLDAAPNLHRYWGLLVRRTAGSGSFMGVTEVEMRSFASGVDMTGNGTASTSKAEQFGVVANAFNDNTTDLVQWASSNNEDIEINYDFGTNITVDVRELLIWPNKDAADRAPGYFELRYSDNGTTWLTVQTGIQTAWAVGVSQTFTVAQDSVARYWGLLELTSAAATGESMAEVQLREITGGADLTGSGTATALTSFGGFPPGNAVDDNNATFWSSNGAQGHSWWRYDLGAGLEHDIDELTVRSRPSGDATQTPHDFRVSYSDDGKLYTEKAIASTTADWSTGEERTFTIEAETTPPVRATQVPVLTVDAAVQAIRATQIPVLAVGVTAQTVRATQIPILPPIVQKPIPLPLALLPDSGVQEAWVYKTTIARAGSSKEQRMALRDVPRYEMSFSVALEDDDKRRAMYQLIQHFFDEVVLYPMFQHASVLTASTAASGIKLFFDPVYTDLRDGEQLALLNPATEDLVYYEISTVDADGATLASPLPADVEEGWYVYPVLSWRIDGTARLAMGTVAGTSSLALESVGRRTFERPGSTASLNTLDGLPILELEPTAGEPAAEEFEMDVSWFDNETSIQDPFTLWAIPFIKGDRDFNFDRTTDMDFWRNFAATAVGKREPFLMPTWRDDLPLSVTPALSSIFITTSNLQYGRYFPQLTYRYVQIHSANGIIYRRVENAVVNYDSNGDAESVTLELDTSIGGSVGDNVISKVSFLNKTRLDNDTITLNHLGHYGTISFSIRTINQ